MNRKSFILSILNAAPILAAASILNQHKQHAENSVILVRKFFSKDDQPFNHEKFNQIIESSFNMIYVQTDHQFMLDTNFIKKFERENFVNHVVFKISFKCVKDLETYKNKISKVIVNRAELKSHFRNVDEVLKG